MTRVLVLAATSTIAKAICHELAEDGANLVLGARDATELDAIASDLELRHDVDAATFTFDALETREHADLMQDVLTAHGPLAGAIVCLGTLGDPGQTHHEPAAARRVIEVNLTGLVSLVTPVADHLAEQGEGFLGIVSSVAGDRGRQSNYVYGAAKAGVSTYAAGLRNRLFHEGVDVVTIKPGFVDTKMTYGQEDMFLVASPERVARATVRACQRGRSVVYVPWFWRPVLWMLRATPEWLFKRLRL